MNGRHVRKGAADAIEEYMQQMGNLFPPAVRATVDNIAKQGATPWWWSMAHG